VPRFPRDVTQEQAIKAFVRCGGIAIAREGKGSHRKVVMPNGQTVTLPYGRLKTGILASAVKQADLSVQKFINAL
jgi:predicted RNA binding protein YcfA (HicA-like mRNA interferase family)